jgi:hypothetical protein
MIEIINKKANSILQENYLKIRQIENLFINKNFSHEIYRDLKQNIEIQDIGYDIETFSDFINNFFKFKRQKDQIPKIIQQNNDLSSQVESFPKQIDKIEFDDLSYKEK